MTQEYIRSRTSIGGSDVATILGLSKYKTPLELYEQIKGDRGEQVSNRHIERGRRAEDWIAELYAEQTGFRVERVDRLYHPELPFHYSLDRRAFANEVVHSHDLGPGILEVKAHSGWVLRDVLKNGVPPYYYAQIQWYYHGTGYEWAEYVTLDWDNWEVVRIPVPRNQAFIDDMVDKVVTWWDRHIVAGEPPAATFLDDEGRQWPMPQVDTVVQRSDPDTTLAFQRLAVARQNFDMAKKSKELAEDQVKEIMGEVGVMEVPGVGRVSWKESTSSHFDKDALAGAAPIDPLKLVAFLVEHGGIGRRDIEFHDRIRRECALDLNQFYNRKASRRFLPKLDT